MLNVEQLRELIIKPTLLDLVMFTEDAMELLVFTCAVESEGGTYLKQLKGPALGIYQMEPATYNDIWANFLKDKNSLLLMLLSNFNITYMPSEDRLIYDLRFATAMARIHYARFLEKLPHAADTMGLWKYYKQYYNTPEGAAEMLPSISKYQKFINL
jgi:hypothetical protein